MAKDPTVSVLMPVYNAQRYLREAVDSVLGQTFTDFELIAVDDGSTDGSLAILREYERKDGRVRVISRPNTGIVGALNDGLAVCRGELIARMDADDVCLPERFEKQVAFLRQHPEVVLLGTRALLVDEDRRPIRYVACETRNERLQAALLQGDGQCVLHPTIMVRAWAVRKLSGYRSEYPISEDLDLYLRLAEQGEVRNLEQLLLEYRAHAASITHRPNAAASYARRAVLDARRRRGLPTDDVAGEDAAGRTVHRSRLQLFQMWAWWAYLSGFRATARKYAWLAWRQAPFDPATIKLLVMSYFWSAAEGDQRLPS
ncbi:MAG: glycosyltransferase family 2 protein [Tepidisphaerales bacterium]